MALILLSRENLRDLLHGLPVELPSPLTRFSVALSSDALTTLVDALVKEVKTIYPNFPEKS